MVLNNTCIVTNRKLDSIFSKVEFQTSPRSWRARNFSPLDLGMFGSLGVEKNSIVMLRGHQLKDWNEYLNFVNKMATISCPPFSSSSGGPNHHGHKHKKRRLSSAEPLESPKVNSLSDHVFTVENNLSDELKFVFTRMRGVLASLARIHKLGYCHCDIRPSNIMYFVELGGYSLIDFDLACKVNTVVDVIAGQQWDYASVFLQEFRGKARDEKVTMKWTAQHDYEMACCFFGNRLMWTSNYFVIKKWWTLVNIQ